MSKGATVVSWERRLDQNLGALPYLPEGTTFAHVRGPLARALLERVAASDGEPAGLAFVEEHCAEQVVLLAAGLLLDAVSALVEIMAPETIARMQPPLEGPPALPTLSPEEIAQMLARRRALYAPLLGGLLDAPAWPFGDVEWFTTLAASSVDDVQAALAWCQWAASLPPGLRPSAARRRRVRLACPALLLADVLRLPVDADALAWLRRERLAECARLAAASALKAVFPAYRGAALGSVPVQRAAGAEGLLVRVERVLRFPGTFDVETTFSARIPRGDDVEGALRHGRIWPGFSRVSDDRRDRYVVRYGSGSWARGPGGRSFGGRLSQECWPALGERRRLVLADAPAAPEFRRPCAAGHSHPAPAPSWGDLRVSVSVG